MAGYVVRIALPDRPGALGLVASRIGAVGGDIVAIHILEREEGGGHRHPTRRPYAGGLTT